MVTDETVGDGVGFSAREALLTLDEVEKSPAVKVKSFELDNASEVDKTDSTSEVVVGNIEEESCKLLMLSF